MTVYSVQVRTTGQAEGRSVSNRLTSRVQPRGIYDDWLHWLVGQEEAGATATLTSGAEDRILVIWH